MAETQDKDNIVRLPKGTAIRDKYPIRYNVGANFSYPSRGNIIANEATSNANLEYLQKQIMIKTKILYGRPIMICLEKILYEMSWNINNKFDTLDRMNDQVISTIMGWFGTVIAQETRYLTWDQLNMYRPSSGGVNKYDANIKLRRCYDRVYPSVYPYTPGLATPR